ncbi:MAG: hypothetical protein A2284_11155 [Deltaproteobacteria bacterium RIFOXYA12_FULL_61_11]|nr:MAG: hypothetical protein A2284_11155 [Deltaproteobacteria bacterium RIFOXYA12_FULL_61_11]
MVLVCLSCTLHDIEVTDAAAEDSTTSQATTGSNHQDNAETSEERPGLDSNPEDATLATNDGNDPGSGTASSLSDGVNDGWIGGSCHSDEDCRYQGGFCLTEVDGFPGGTCSLACESQCPSPAAPTHTSSGCIAIDKVSSREGSSCIASCDPSADESGCRPGYRCTRRLLFQYTSRSIDVCLPDDVAHDQEPLVAWVAEASGCLAHLATLDLPIESTEHTASNPACAIEYPVLFPAILNGFTFFNSAGQATPLKISCRMAVALMRMIDVMHDLGLDNLTHLGVYNCKVSADGKPSRHGMGNAIDVAKFHGTDGTTYTIYQYYFQNTDVGRMLRNIAEQLHQHKVFNQVLTPEYNEQHANHFHLDLTWPEYPNEWNKH